MYNLLNYKRGLHVLTFQIYLFRGYISPLHHQPVLRTKTSEEPQRITLCIWLKDIRTQTDIIIK